MRTPIAIEGLVLDSDGAPATGAICLTPTTSTTNGSSIYDVQPVCGAFDADGRITGQSGEALTVLASDDAGTTPVVTYIIALTVTGQPQSTFRAQVPSASTVTEPSATTVLGSTSVALSSLIVSSSMVGRTIAGSNWPVGSTVVAVNSATNSLTLSQAATATGSCIATVGGAVSITDLLAAQL